MVRILMLDLGQTLVDGTHPFPHVPEALAAMREFETAPGEPLALSLVSDFTMATPPVTSAKVEALFQQYLTILDGFGLRQFFEPVTRRVTLSTHARKMKPDRKVFETAIQRLDMTATLNECLYITENAEHIQHCRQMNMQTLRFGGHVSPPAPGADFNDWSEAPLMIARLVAPPLGGNNLTAAIRVRLRAMHPEWEIGTAQAISDDTIRLPVSPWIPLHDSQLGDMNGVHVQMSVPAVVKLDSRGRIKSVREEQPSEEDIAEAVHNVRSLRSSEQVEGQPSRRGPTHSIETDASGRRLLKRQRFTAW